MNYDVILANVSKLIRFKKNVSDFAIFDKTDFNTRTKFYKILQSFFEWIARYIN